MEVFSLIARPNVITIEQEDGYRFLVFGEAIV